MVKRQPNANKEQYILTFSHIIPYRVNQLIDIFRKKILQRGCKGIIGLQRVFKIMDDDGSKSLSRQEFEKACRDFKMDIP